MVKVKINIMDEIKKQIVERLKQANNILVTVRNDPNVDLLSACIGLALVLDKMDKHAAAVFSGKVPSAMEFLKPEETIEQTPDSLRDFIIALDKSKADKLRYKVEDTVVRIFITPYKTSLSQADLEFSQGDFNVDAVVALGVHEQQELDQAITVHGRILHDATIISINNTPNGSLGSMNWQEISASSISEMVAELVKDLKSDAPDAQIATALLTGIVAETERFSNDKTTPQTMTVAGELMAAGANQQLVATSLQAVVEREAAPAIEPTPEGEQPSDVAPIKVSDDGTLEIDHGGEGDEKAAEPELRVKPIQEEPTPLPEPSQVIKPAEPELPKIVAPSREMLPTPSPARASGNFGSPLQETPFTAEFDESPAAARSYLVDRPDVPGVPLTEPRAVNPIEPPVAEPPTPLLKHDDPPIPPVAPPTFQSSAAAPVPLLTPPVPPLEQPQPVAPNIPTDIGLPLPAPVITPSTLLHTAPPAPVDMPLPSTTSPSSQTLRQIEELVHSPHVEPPTNLPGHDVNAARGQVMDAFASQPSKAEPLQSLNASPLGGGLHPHNDMPTPAAAMPNLGITVDAEGNLMQQTPPSAQSPAMMPMQPGPGVPTPPPFNRPRPEPNSQQPAVPPNNPPPVPPPITPQAYF